MPAAEPLATDWCALSERWAVDQDVMRRMVRLASRVEQETGRRVYIISGWRSVAHQLQLKQQGRPAANPALSTHCSCPATGVDISMGLAPTKVMKAILGRIAVEEGLRWGGGSPVGQDGIPSDWNHFDRGPRRNG